MKKFRIKLASFLGWAYGTGIFVSLFAGALSFVGYLAAIVIGGQTAEMICTYIYKGLYPILFYISSLSVLAGLAKMYVSGEESMTASKKK